MRRDFAFVLDRDVPAGDVRQGRAGADKALIAGVSVFDVFEGESAGRGQEVARHRSDAAAAREDADRQEIEAVAAEDRRRRQQGDRRRDPQIGSTRLRSGALACLLRERLD